MDWKNKHSALFDTFRTVPFEYFGGARVIPRVLRISEMKRTHSCISFPEKLRQNILRERKMATLLLSEVVASKTDRASGGLAANSPSWTSGADTSSSKIKYAGFHLASPCRSFSVLKRRVQNSYLI